MEVNCPLNQRDNYIFEAIENDNFYLTKMNNSTNFSVAHQNYHQIQTKIHVTKKVIFVTFFYGPNRNTM